MQTRRKDCAALHVAQFMVIFLGVGSQSERAAIVYDCVELTAGTPVVQGCEARRGVSRSRQGRSLDFERRQLRAPAGLCKLDGAQMTLHKLPNGSQCELPDLCTDSAVVWPPTLHVLYSREKHAPSTRCCCCL